MTVAEFPTAAPELRGYGDLMHESGVVPLRTLGAILGHAGATFTLRTYAYSSDAAMSAASAMLASLFETRSVGSL